MCYEGSERFSLNGNEINLSICDFWRWAYSDFSDNVYRSVHGDFLVASSIGTSSASLCRGKSVYRHFDIISKEGYRIEIKTAAYVQSFDGNYPDHISFRIAPIKGTETGPYYSSSVPRKRHSDLHVFCLYKGLTVNDSHLNIDLWEFFVLPTKVLDEKRTTKKTISLSSLLHLSPIKCDYNGISEAINKAMNT